MNSITHQSKQKHKQKYSCMKHFEEDFPYISDIDQTDGYTNYNSYNSADTKPKFDNHVKLEELKKIQKPIDIEFSAIKKQIENQDISINIGTVASWFFGLFFSFIGFVMMFSNFGHIFTLLAGLVILPPINKYLSNNFYRQAGFKVSSWKAVVAFFVLFSVAIVATPSSQSNNREVAGAREQVVEVVESDEDRERREEAEEKLRLRNERIARDEEENRLAEEEKQAEAKKAEEQAAAKKLEEEKLAKEEAEKKAAEEARIAEEQEAQRAAQEQQQQNTVVNNTPAPTPQPEPEPTRQPVSNPTPEPQPVRNPTNGRTGARCRDGSLSGATGRGACSHHGGVAEWLY